ncbi:hypothetical protein EDWATA_01242 [Edwardsiella tarda ATCC 23685]|uniref:Uncharacterized protein n=1 Tax=Edwardsiella tarda ATCC 23685 TaxID=500638 RepID=D4F3D9_EDWTA|nr:hypothetical protein EDWATA_01242 [Edwardsiella tarda ATCC 23685]
MISTVIDYKMPGHRPRARPVQHETGRDQRAPTRVEPSMRRQPPPIRRRMPPNYRCNPQIRNGNLAISHALWSLGTPADIA